VLLLRSLESGRLGSSVTEKAADAGSAVTGASSGATQQLGLHLSRTPHESSSLAGLILTVSTGRRHQSICPAAAWSVGDGQPKGCRCAASECRRPVAVDDIPAQHPRSRRMTPVEAYPET